MIIKDIVNRDNVDLQNCESEPIHIPGCIQEHGFLLGVQLNSFQITYCSGNIHVLTGRSPEEMLGKTLGDIFSNEQQSGLHNFVSDASFDQTQQFVLHYNNVPYNTRPFITDQVIVLELEPFPDGSQSVPDLYKQTQKLVRLLERADNLQELSQAIADETRSITGYDRVMIYRFDKDYNGEVYAESKRDDLLPLLGHHYPHTDIPAQARALYLQNMLRMIADVNYTPVALYTLANENTEPKPLDLSLSVLRSVSPMHIEYLKNMGVRATLTISLILDGRLWGMIACHHYEDARNIPHFTRLSALLQGYFFTSQIKVRQAADEYKEALHLDNCLKPLMERIAADDFFIRNQYSDKALFECLNASGVAIVQDGEIFSNGIVPSEEEIRGLLQWLKVQSENGSYITDRLIAHYPGAAALGGCAAGIIYFALDPDAVNAIIWFRPEMEKAINWAGNPSKSMTMDSNGARLSPRKSFELWKEIVKNQSQEWTGPERNVAGRLAYHLQKQVYLMRIRQEEENYRKLAVRLKALNTELEDFNWISAHDLKEPLRKIQVFASRASYSSNTIEVYQDSLLRIQNAAFRMQQLLDSMLSFAEMSKSADHFQLVNLQETLEATLENFEEQLNLKSAKVSVTGKLPELFVIPGQIEKLFTHLLSNAINFSRPDAPLKLDIHAQTDSQPVPEPNGGFSVRPEYCHVITFKDNGIGFNNKFSETIFRIFQVLDRSNSTVGIGLPLCKKIMDNHDGSIEAFGKEGEGATFTLRFPC